MEHTAGWAGSVSAFLESADDTLIAQLEEWQGHELGMPPAGLQLEVWREQTAILRYALEECLQARKEARDWSVILEYELPLEGGRRPDVVILTGTSIAVLEFKQATVATRAFVDQTESYARDLSDYHAGSHGRHVLPVLVLTKAHSVAVDFTPVVITGRDELAHYLIENAVEGRVSLEDWLDAPYEPLPTLVAAARQIFRDKPLPHVHTALAEDIPGTLQRIGELIIEAEANRERKLLLITGVPGSGKTLVGLRLVYERTETAGRGLLLSGNGPLVTVLQDALESRVFVRDLHAFIKTYGVNGRTPAEKVIVFDEAQRAWDADYMYFKRGVRRSEPDLLIEAGERIPDWGVLVGLVGEGQEIFSGEEAGIDEWGNAIRKNDPTKWVVHAPSDIAASFEGCNVRPTDKLDLKVPLRSRRASLLHDWVSHVLGGSLALAARIAARLSADRTGFPLYLTRDLEQARAYARLRYANEPDKRFGLVVKAYAKAPRTYDVDNHFQAQVKLKLGPWYNADPDNPLSCCQLNTAVTEFQVQGLELDLPIVCWGENFIWTGSDWRRTPARARYPQADPEQLLVNGYRVLLTRGRDALLIWLPPEERFDLTEHALLAAGVRPLDEVEDEVRKAVVGDAS
jgi:hypothetical protein